jgi:dTDP-L-rhamnose 4-epimerase
MDRVLITGGCGFIGSHVTDLLLRNGTDVRLFDNLHPQVHPGGRRPSYLPPGVEMIRGDVRDLDALRAAMTGVTHVVHLAAETSVGQSMSQGDVHIDVNVRGTATVLRAIREAGPDVRRVIISSSRAVYGEGAFRCDGCGLVHPGPRRREDLEEAMWSHRCPSCGAALSAVATREDAETRYTSSYGMTKLFQERVAKFDAGQIAVDLVVLRYFNVYGPRQSPSNPYTGLITTLAVRLMAGKPLVLYEEGTPLRDFVHVFDVARATVDALGGDVQPSTINIGTGDGVTLAELAPKLGTAFGLAPAIEVSTRFRLGDIHASIADGAAAYERLGYRPEVSLQDGLNALALELASVAVEDRSDAVEDELRRTGVLRG